MRNFKHINANTIDEAVGNLGDGKAKVIAGGTDLLGAMKEEVLPRGMFPETIINLKTISPSLDYIKEEGGVLKIGALTILEDIAKSSVVKNKWGALAEAARRTASPHLREMGTLGGNICQLNRCWYFRMPNDRFFCLRKGGGVCYAMAGDNRYHSIFGATSGCLAVNCSDTAPALVALNATIKTNKRDIPAEEFWAAPMMNPSSTVLEDDEIVTEISVPALSGKSAFTKMALRTSIDFPVVNCAVAIDGNNVKICLNAVKGIPYRAKKAEEAIAGKTINESTAEAASTAAIEGTVVLAPRGQCPGNKYKIQIAKALVKKTLLACA